MTLMITNRLFERKIFNSFSTMYSVTGAWKFLKNCVYADENGAHSYPYDK